MSTNATPFVLARAPNTHVNLRPLSSRSFSLTIPSLPQTLVADLDACEPFPLSTLHCLRSSADNLLQKCLRPHSLSPSVISSMLLQPCNRSCRQAAANSSLLRRNARSSLCLLCLTRLCPPLTSSPQQAHNTARPDKEVLSKQVIPRFCPLIDLPLKHQAVFCLRSNRARPRLCAGHQICGGGTEFHEGATITRSATM